MPELKLTYFDIAGSRGEEVRLALSIAGLEFEDVRVAGKTFAELKPELPFGSLPVLEVAGHGVFAQSNAILRLIGAQHGLHPKDPFEAARHDSIMDAVEDLRHRISPALRIDDPVERKAVREQLSVEHIPMWANYVERMMKNDPFIAGKNIHVADIKIFMVDKWLAGGIIDDISASVLDPYPKIKTVANAVKNHPAVVNWYATTS